MATSNLKTHNTALPTVGFAPVTYLVNTVKRMVTWQRVYHSTFEELSQLSDRELADINISRTDVRNIAVDSANEAVAKLAK